MKPEEYNDKNKIAILIPAYNEEKYIKSVIKDCLSYHLDIIIVDDGSVDNTFKKIKSIPEPDNSKITLIRHRVNKGKGQSLRTGFLYVIKNNYSGIITIDADGQHDTGEIVNFLKIIEKENPDLIIGNRLSNTKNMPFIRLATNVFTSWIISIISGRKIRDVQSGFRYLKTDVIKNIKLETGNFDTEPEIIMKSIWYGYNIKNIPIKTIYHKNFTSYVNPATDTIKFFKLVFNSFRWKRKFFKKNKK
ncbi:MAG: glycosyltransferase family 2 protein [Actinomycetota bacterium]|nr:glycosyltransferase family 2 protein [Actinomycetota bacterium]